ncbi:MAG: hypothetical protein EP298_05265 [Gammaproteobacteria bacterium]|nr:MAG: hypothetical protein EP298_05265 [Gammaproteobacteria bacterium]UTW42467.1 hypothetical protein KFE69_13490 [bacterium SCSIO 12844]
MEENKQLTNNQSSNVITIADLILILIKRIKLFISIVVLGIIMSIIAFIYKQNAYLYGYTLNPPQYLSINTSNPPYNANSKIVSNNKLIMYLNSYIAEMQQIAKYADIREKISQIQLFGTIDYKESPYVSIYLKGHLNDQSQTYFILNKYIQFTQQQLQHDIIQPHKNDQLAAKQVLEQQAATTKNKINEIDKNIHDLAVLSHNNTQSPQTLKRQLNLASNQQSQYTKALARLQLQINAINASLKSFTNLSIGKKIAKIDKPVGLSKAMVLPLGIILSIIVALGIVFLVEYVSNLFIEIKRKKSANIL